MITVVVPVFNGEKYLIEAIESLLNYTIVSEILVIDDGSTDNSLDICKNLAKLDNRILVLFHKENCNLGPSASRNLGVLSARFPFIAFLDADDYFLPNRFKYFERLISTGKEFDGIYEAVQYFNGSDKIYSVVNPDIKPKYLFHYLIRGTYGHFHTNGLIVKKELLLKAGLFNEALRLHQDSELWLKLAYYGQLFPGSLTRPVAMVRMHEGNRIWKGTSNTSRLKQWKVTWNWAWNKPVGLINKLLILRKLLKYKIDTLKE